VGLWVTGGGAVAEYRYSTHTPRTNHWRASDLPGHVFGYKSRRLVLVPGNHSQYLPHCSCKWKYPAWFGTPKAAEREWERHIHDMMETQPTLF